MQGEDISDEISVIDTSCSAGSSSSGGSGTSTAGGSGSGSYSGMCWPCDLTAAEQGRCLPGRYHLNFTGGCLPLPLLANLSARPACLLYLAISQDSPITAGISTRNNPCLFGCSN